MASYPFQVDARIASFEDRSREKMPAGQFPGEQLEIVVDPLALIFHLTSAFAELSGPQTEASHSTVYVVEMHAAEACSGQEFKITAEP